jgi:hypothetical protein
VLRLGLFFVLVHLSLFEELLDLRHPQDREQYEGCRRDRQYL